MPGDGLRYDAGIVGETEGVGISQMRELQGKVAVVTGAASGIGFGMATRFAEAGLKVVMADVEKPVLDKAVASLKNQGLDVVGITTDVSDWESVADLASETLSQYGAVQILSNNAGVTSSGMASKIWEHPQSDWDWVYGVNFWGVLNGIRAFVPVMLEMDEECHIVNTASVAGLVAYGSIYGSTKTGVVDISETLVMQLRSIDSKIGVSVLCPGAVNTQLLNSSRNRPPEYSFNPSSEDVPAELQRVRDASSDLLRNGRDPLEVGDIVVEAIKQNRFYVLTDDVWNHLIESRPRDIFSGNPPTHDREIAKILGLNSDAND
jgi:NAD(P)-dependent dehydrogenase (short-subunit alcohol dehydrogenase family)